MRLTEYETLQRMWDIYMIRRKYDRRGWDVYKRMERYTQPMVCGERLALHFIEEMER